MNLQQRILLLTNLGDYMASEADEWTEIKLRAEQLNPWFTQEFLSLSVKNITKEFLQKDKLQQFAEQYNLPKNNENPKNVGLVMAGNIPMVGFHDFLHIFITGHRQTIKLSSKDEVLIKHLVHKFTEWDEEGAEFISFQDMLKGCDAYIATGSNNSGRYFEYYFAKYPHIIRRNRTSVSILTGSETQQELDLLSDDIHLYFGLGCRNVTKIYVPQGYNFEQLLEACKKYNYFFDLQKYKNNYDYQLALLLMNKVSYKSTGSLLLTENSQLFTPISVLNYEYYDDENQLRQMLQLNDNIQCVVGKNAVDFGQAQAPGLNDYADGVDTMEFLSKL